ncbi:hypothetical protein [Nocardia sp.]|uniref:hypothetical protein n=1 Tax=Nocardia sp. TaxID=1821 RepID=UPI00260BF197|nr:hypothetical protein [Nocardia sp.]
MVEIAILRAFPDPVQLRHRSRVLAMLDCLLSGNAHTHPGRAHRFVEHWRDREWKRLNPR